MDVGTMGFGLSLDVLGPHVGNMGVGLGCGASSSSYINTGLGLCFWAMKLKCETPKRQNKNTGSN